MFRSTIFALSLATLAAAPAFAGKQPPQVGQENDGKPAVTLAGTATADGRHNTRVSEYGQGEAAFPQVATLPRGSGHADGR